MLMDFAIRSDSGRSGRRCPLLAHANHDLDAIGLHALRQPRKATELDVARIDIQQLTGVDIMKMMMGRAGRVIHRTFWIKMDLAHETMVCEHLERVVDRRLRDPLASSAQRRQDLISSDVGRRVHQDFSDTHPLIRGLEPDVVNFLRDLLARQSGLRKLHVLDPS